MSTSLDKGYTRGREYLRRCPIEKVTFEQYKNIGKVDVKQQYKQKKAQDAYLLGWWYAGEQFASLFKTNNNDAYSGLKRISLLQQELGNIAKDLDALQNWRENDALLQDFLQTAVEELGLAIEMLSCAKDRIESQRNI